MAFIRSWPWPVDLRFITGKFTGPKTGPVNFPVIAKVGNRRRVVGIILNSLNHGLPRMTRIARIFSVSSSNPFNP
jgi:hypothetical protein